MATTTPEPETKPRQWRCLLLFGHKWRRSVNEGMAFKRCVRCGKEREIPAVVQYPGHGPDLGGGGGGGFGG